MRSFEPENMDQATLESFASESWLETVLFAASLYSGHAFSSGAA